MTGAEIWALISGVLKFPGDVLALVKFLQSTPSENQQAAREAMRSSMDVFRQTGRPKEW